ncbi:hypothetical protein Mycsm_04773 [Mycobacterium sp. JS623]|nr:hypothetical protein Mycsm_04773 [Mycobacterium sp. JS623]
MLSAVIGGSAVVAAGALTMAISQQQATPATITSSGMTVGATSTQETPPTSPETTIAVPLVKATRFGGAGSSLTFHLRSLRLPS